MARLQYANAHAWYKNLDKLIHYINADGRLNVFYSRWPWLTALERCHDCRVTLLCNAGAGRTYISSSSLSDKHRMAPYLGCKVDQRQLDSSCSIQFACCCSPEAYVAAKHAMKEAWPLKTDDFFPYADCPHCYWTGETLTAAPPPFSRQQCSLCCAPDAISRTVLVAQSSH